jgi:hypothetical protein
MSDDLVSRDADPVSGIRVYRNWAVGYPRDRTSCKTTTGGVGPRFAAATCVLVILARQVAVAIQVDVGRIGDGDAIDVVFHDFPLHESLGIRILISDGVGDIDTVASWLRRIAERLEQGAFSPVPSAPQPD